MKNIYLIPTEKPSRLYKSKITQNIFISNIISQHGDATYNQHLYITSDEEIKEGDWGFDGLDIFKCLKPFIANETTSGKNIPCFYIEYDGKSNIFHETSYIKKIILTTDQDLINDGVQAISDEFLEWFVKNPSCESVEIENTCLEVRICDCAMNEDCLKPGYKIIIPQEEDEQDDIHRGGFEKS
jgi:hypothetical protein